MPDAKQDAPRWPGGPPICAKEGLLCFDNLDAAKAFLTKDAPHYSIKSSRKCSYCGSLHVEPVLAGDDARLGGAALGFVPFKRKASGSSTSTAQEELPKARQTAAGDQPPAPQPPRPKPKQAPAKQGSLL